MAHIKDLWFTETADGKVPTSRHGKGRRWKLYYVDDLGKTRYPTFAKKVEAGRAPTPALRRRVRDPRPWPLLPPGHEHR